MILNKKGMGEIALWTIRIIMLASVVVVINFVRLATIETSLKTYDTEFYIANNRVLYSPAGITYTSLDTGRTYPGIIDIDRFDDTALNASAGRKIPMKMILMEMDRTVIKEIYYDKERYDLLEPLTFSGQYDKIEKTHYVMIKQGDELKPGLLDMEMVVSR